MEQTAPPEKRFFFVLFSSWIWSGLQRCKRLRWSVELAALWTKMAMVGDRASNEAIGAKQKWPPRNANDATHTKGAFLATILLESDGEKQHQEVDVISHSLTYFLMTVVIIQRRLAPWWLVMMISTWRWYNQMNHLAYSLGHRRFHPCIQSLWHAKSDV